MGKGDKILTSVKERKGGKKKGQPDALRRKGKTLVMGAALKRQTCKGPYRGIGSSFKKGKIIGRGSGGGKILLGKKEEWNMIQS